MTATGYTSGDPRKVSRTGDTMSGDLELLGAADLMVADDVAVGDDMDVAGTSTVAFTGVTLDVAQLLTMGLSTSIISGGELTPNADPTKIDISALTGYFVTYDSSQPLGPTNPLLTFLSFPAQIGLTPGFPVTWFLVTALGVLVQQPATPTPTQRRTNLVVGLTASAGGIIVVDQTLPVIPSQVNNQLTDLMESLTPFGTTGNLLSANGVNLTFNKTVGQMFARGFSAVPTFQDPHNSILVAQKPAQFRTITADPTFFGPLASVVDRANYDPNGLGVITPIGGGANTSTNFRIWGFANNTATEQILVQYGQNTYASLTAARDGIGSGLFVVNPNTVGGALLGWISITRTATNLSNPAQAVFSKASKFATP